MMSSALLRRAVWQVSVSFVGEVTGSGSVELVQAVSGGDNEQTTTKPFNLPLELVLGDVPRKVMYAILEGVVIESLASNAHDTSAWHTLNDIFLRKVMALTMTCKVIRQCAWL